MKNLAISFLFFVTCLVRAEAQLANGTVAPDFTATDINGVSHNLYSLLNQGKTVYIDFSATWCHICWNYHSTNALKNLWNTYGPPGTNEAYVFFIESFEPSNTNCLYGPSGCNNSTLGNWVAGTPYPIIDNAAIGNLFQISFYPVVLCICPLDKKLYAVGTQNMAGLWNARNANCGSALQTTNSVTNVKCFGSNTGAIDLTVSGAASPYTYNWSNGATSQDLLNISAGTYTCTVTAANGITQSTSPISVAGPNTPLSIAQTGYTEPFCNGVLGTVTTTSSGGWGGYTYLWSNGQTTATASNLSTGTYTITVSDNSTCSRTLTATVGSSVLPAATIATPAPITCAQPAVQLNGTGSSTGANFTYSWTASNGGNINGSSSSLITSANSAGIYTLVVTNTTTACTRSAVSTIITNTTPPVAAAATPGVLNCNVTQLQLNGNGSSVGNNFTYNWTTTNGSIVAGQNTISPVVNMPGNYQLQVTNSNNGCTATASTLVLQNQAVTASIASNIPVACFGGSNGTASVNAGGGSGIFTYLWNNGATSNLVNGLSAGIYTATVTDNSNCSATIGLTISQPAALMPNATSSSQTLVGVNNGVASAAPTGGTPNYSFVWSNGATTNTINNLAPGNYTVTTSDASNCTAVQTVVVNSVSCAISGTISVQNLLCANSGTGSVALTLTGGSAPFSYLWNTGATTADLANLQAGTYTVSATDAAGCIVTESALVSQATLISVNAIASGQTVVGVNNGTASATPSGGTPGYTYIWNNGATSSTLSNLAPGNYTVTVSDASNCTAAQTVAVNAHICSLSGAISTQNVLCANKASGSATMALSGGTSPFSYLWNTGATAAGLANLEAGTYTVSATDAAGCIVTESILITQPTPISLNAVASGQTAVGLNNGTANAATAGGTPGYNYIWSNGATTATITGIAPGNYTVTVADNNGCTAIQSVEVSAFVCVIAAPATVVPASCASQPNGYISVFVSGGTPPFAYLWNTGATTSSLLNILPGNYSIVLTDNSGCQITATYTIGINDPIMPAINCPGNIRVCHSDSIVQFNPPIATDNCGNAGLQVTQTGGLPSNSAFPLGSTLQMFKATDVSGNSASCTFEVIVSPPFVVDSVAVVHASNNQNNGTINISISGGTPLYNYFWTNSAGQLVGTGKSIAGLASGFYTVKVVDIFDCVFFYTVEVKQLTGTNTIPAWVEGVSLTPNPAKGFFTLTLKQVLDAPIKLSITNTTGQLVYEEILHQQLQTSIQCQSWPSGMYLVRMQSEGGQYSMRIMVLD